MGTEESTEVVPKFELMHFHLKSKRKAHIVKEKTDMGTVHEVVTLHCGRIVSDCNYPNKLWELRDTNVTYHTILELMSVADVCKSCLKKLFANWN